MCKCYFSDIVNYFDISFAQKMTSTYRPSRMISLDIFATLLIQREDKLLLLQRTPKKNMKQNKKNYIFVKIFLLILWKGIFILVCAYVKVLYLDPSCVIFILISLEYMSIVCRFSSRFQSFYYFRKPFCSLNKQQSFMFGSLYLSKYIDLIIYVL